MALNPRDFPITREDVSGWLKEYNRLKKKPDLRTFVQDKLDALNLPDTMVNTSGHEDRGDQTPILDMLMDDIKSYA